MLCYLTVNICSKMVIKHKPTQKQCSAQLLTSFQDIYPGDNRASESY